LRTVIQLLEKYRIAKPEVKLRRMKTLWGSCSPYRGNITFNQYLTKAIPAWSLDRVLSITVISPASLS